MREKFVEERHSRYMIFGQSPDGTKVNVSTDCQDVASRINREQAELLVANHNRAIDALVALALRMDEVDHEWFSNFWYVTQLENK